MKAYYEARAAEYDDWYRGLGRFDGLGAPSGVTLFVDPSFVAVRSPA